MIVKLSHIQKKFANHVIFKDFSLNVEENSFTVLYGKSGCGKSTLLNIIGLLDSPDSGEVELFGIANVKPYTKEAEKLLRNKIGYLFQNFALEDDETVEKNLSIAITDKKIKKSQRTELIKEALKKVGLVNFENKKIHECSGGEQQRIALARLLLKPCELILADEPTGNLDKENKHLIFQLLQEFKEAGKTLIVVTHDDELRNLGDRCIDLQTITKKE